MTLPDAPDGDLLGEVTSPVTREMLDRLDPTYRYVHFTDTLTSADYRRLAEFLSKHPDVGLATSPNYCNSLRNLDFLEHFPFLKRFSLNVHDVEDIRGLRHLSKDLEELEIGLTKKKTFSMSILDGFHGLTTLSLEGHTKDIGAIANLSALEELTLRSITLPNLEILKPLGNLLSLDLKLGGIRDLSALPALGKLRYLELWMLRGLSDITPVGGVSALQFLFLESLKNVTRLPPFTTLKRLRRVGLQNMKGVRNLTPLKDAPALEELSVIDMDQLNPEDFQCLQGHPTLKRFWVGTQSHRKNEAIRKVLPLPEADSVGDDFEFR